MKFAPNRDPITTSLVSHVATASNRPCGDAEKPDDGGWEEERKDSPFIPYSVITPMPSGDTDGPITDPHGDVDFVYSISCFGRTRHQCEQMADLARRSAQEFIGTEVSGVRVRYVWVSQYGLTRRFDNPNYYSQTDTVSVSVTRITDIPSPPAP